MIILDMEGVGGGDEIETEALKVLIELGFLTCSTLVVHILGRMDITDIKLLERLMNLAKSLNDTWPFSLAKIVVMLQ